LRLSIPETLDVAGFGHPADEEVAMDTGVQEGRDTLIRELSVPIFQSKGWLRLLGILSILFGVLMVITVVGITIAWLPIWMGVLLIQSATAIERAYVAGDKARLMESMDKLKAYFTISGILAIIGLVLIVIGMFVGFFASLVPYMNY
jgi:hypothetical protein